MDKESFAKKYNQYSKEANEKFREKMINDITDAFRDELPKFEEKFKEESVVDISTAMIELHMISQETAVSIVLAEEKFHEAKNKYILEKLFTE